MTAAINSGCPRALSICQLHNSLGVGNGSIQTQCSIRLQYLIRSQTPRKAGRRWCWY
jgi:hypothetical protein